SLVDIDIYDRIEDFFPLLKQQEHNQIIEKVYQLSSVKKSAKTINTAINRAAKVVFALKSYARYDDSGEKVKSQITNEIETVLTLYHNQLKHGVEVIRNYEEVDSIYCYPDELNQVWTNIIHNSLQAMKNMGKLEINVKQREEQVLVSITDSGEGIAPEIKEKIFTPFFTTKPTGEGSGMGLDIVKRIVDKHQGNITVASVPGQTTFTISLPINP
ncbi:MAG: GHKL domain-containing protein, partial [Okeania sp. SIO2D1]|nr:GHKL domain-containing protein [Okeania sp. SIO2D1]